MSRLSFVAHAADPSDDTHSHITDLEIITLAGTAYLYSGTRYDGVLRQWSIDGGPLTISADLDYQGGDRPGGIAGVTTIFGASDPIVLTGGGEDGQLQLVDLNSDGSFGTTTSVADLPDAFAGFQNGETLSFSDGATFIYGTLAGQGGLAQMTLDASGTILDQTVLFDPTPQTNQIAAVATTTVGTQSFVVTASGAQNGLTTHAVDQDGNVTNANTIDADDGLWINAPTAMEVVSIGGGTYAILGAAGTDSLSVIEITADGSMIVRDHILDARETRFGGVTSLEVVQIDSHTYVIAGGADDGLSVFMLLEGGLLVHLAAIEDTDDVSLDNISALAGRVTGTALDIFVGSSSETGITHVQFDTGPIGITATATLAGGALRGTVGSDVLQGHDGEDVILAGAGDDLLRDGAGSDVMTGGAGADIFILSRDGEDDTITDFVIGEDRIDLSLWPMLRDISQLFITIEENGMRITYGDETLFVQSADGAPIDYRDLSTTDVINISRLPIGPEPGYPGPALPPPNIGNPPDPPAADQGGANNILTPIMTLIAGNLDLLREEPIAPGLVIDGVDTAEILSGSADIDLIFAGNGDDTVFGLSGDDTLFGRDGNDTIDGGDGADTLLGGNGADEIVGGNGQDFLSGGMGADILSGGAGNDILRGDGGADTFIFQSGADQILDFEQGSDSIVLDPGLWTGLTSAADVLFVYGSFEGATATIDFGDGNTLQINGVTDQQTLASDIFLF